MLYSLGAILKSNGLMLGASLVSEQGTLHGGLCV
jgi:hypothetical protein